MEKVTFISAKYGDTLINGVAVDFIIKYTKTNSAFLKDVNFNSLFKVTLTRYALIQWGMLKNIDSDKLIKLTFPFAVKWISERVKDGTLKEFEEKIISTEDKIYPYPFDLKKIDKIEGYEIIFSDNTTDVGSRIETNLLADSIIGLRDNINALIYSKHREILLKLNQERNILNLFRKIENDEQFFYAISTLRNLVNDINPKLLKKITGTNEKHIKTFALLKNFLQSIDDDTFQVVETFRTINRICQGFPIHSDKSDLIKNLRKYNIDYPINDYDIVWKKLLEKYKDGLTELLEIIKKYAA